MGKLQIKNIIKKSIKKLVYADYTASGRGLKQIESFISNQILPFYANVHSSSGYLSEQSEYFRNESKTIVRRFVNSDEKDSIIYSGQGTTSCVNKLIKLMNLAEYVNFYKELKIMNELKIDFVESMNKLNLFNNKENLQDKEKLENLFFTINEKRISNIKNKFVSLFNITNFCYSNRWGSYDCILCRMTFSNESQYNEHEKSSTHKINLDQCANINDIIFNSYTNDIKEMIENYSIFEPVIFLSIFEHNSNALPWRETGAKIIYVENDENNNFNYINLEEKLKLFKNNIIKIGTFSAASNITGVYLDTDYISLILHQNNALAFFDYATASPYVKIDMNKALPVKYREKLGFNKKFNSEEEKLIYKDSLFFSPHKFVGGPNTPGVLIIKQHVVRNLLIPSEPGGGVVLFVRKEQQNYVKNIEMREESGTPDIIGSVRIGLCLMIKEKVTDDLIISKERELNSYITNELNNIPNLFLLGQTNNNIDKIPIYSFVIKFSGRIFHFNFISSLLNDLFGIQSRGGCSCASTYGQKCLGLEEEYIENLEKVVCNGAEIFRPGYTRVNFPYFYDKEVIDYIIFSIKFVAKYGYLFLSHYAFKIESGEYYHRSEEDQRRKWLNQIDFVDGNILIPALYNENDKKLAKEDLEEMKKKAEEIIKDMKNITKHTLGKSKINHKILFEEKEDYRWFLIPDDLEHLNVVNNYHNITEEDNCEKDYCNKVEKERNKELIVKFNLERKNINEENINNLKEEIPNHNKINEKIIYNETNDEDCGLINIDANNLNNKKSNKKNKDSNLFPEIPKKIIHLVGEASKDFDMIKNGDKILVAMSGGKDSTSLLHILLYFQKKVPFKFEIGGVTVDPQSPDYDPKPMIEYMKKLGVKYFFESSPILERAKVSLQNDSICAFCARMKRGIIYSCARREGYNVIAMGQHLDDLAESFLMSAFHNGMLRTMKANYVIDQGDLRVIRPLVYCREKLFKEFVLNTNLPVIQENCPACFSAPKERHRIKVLLAQQENLFPYLFSSLLKSMKPLMKGALESDTSKKDDIEI